MEVKKSPKADLEGRKSTWLLVGYVVVLAFMFVAFEWTQRDVKIDTSQAVADLVFEEEIIPITETPEQQAPPPPEAPKVAELLEIVDDKAEIDETTTIINEDNAAPVDKDSDYNSGRYKTFVAAKLSHDYISVRKKTSNHF